MAQVTEAPSSVVSSILGTALLIWTRGRSRPGQHPSGWGRGGVAQLSVGEKVSRAKSLANSRLPQRAQRLASEVSRPGAATHHGLVRSCTGPARACGVSAPLRRGVCPRGIWWAASPNAGCPCGLQCCLEGPGPLGPCISDTQACSRRTASLLALGRTSSRVCSVTSNRHPSAWPGPDEETGLREVPSEDHLARSGWSRRQVHLCPFLPPWAPAPWRVGCPRPAVAAEGQTQVQAGSGSRSGARSSCSGKAAGAHLDPGCAPGRPRGPLL